MQVEDYEVVRCEIRELRQRLVKPRATLGDKDCFTFIGTGAIHIVKMTRIHRSYIMTGIGIIVIHKALEITYFVRIIGFSKHIMVAAVVITLRKLTSVNIRF